MVDHSQQLSAEQMAGTIPVGRALMPQELAEFKAKGREWSRLYKEKRRKEFSAEQVEERKLKNRLRQKRFRERQKSREQEEQVRLATSLHQQQVVDPQHHHQPHAQGDYDPETLHFAEPSGQTSGKLDEEEEASLAGHMSQPQETLVEKRKRLGRERQARFREKKRVRSQQQQSGGSLDGAPAGMASATSQQHHEVMTLGELQKMSAQLSGYYTGLTQGLSQEEHQAVMRFFLDNIREELGEEVFVGPPAYAMADAQAAAAQYMVAGQQGLDLQALQAAAAAHMPQADMQAHLQAHHQAGHMDHPGHLQGHLVHQAQLAPEGSQETPGELTQAQLDSYHRQIAEHQAQQASLGSAQQQNEAYQTREGKDHSQGQNAAQHLSGAEQQSILYGQAGVHQEMLQANAGLHYVNSNPEHH